MKQESLSLWRRISVLILPPAAAAVAALVASCEGPLPIYPVPDTLVRLIPEVAAVGEEGGPVFVLVELEQPEGEEPHVIVYVRAKGAEAEALPGPTLCAQASGGSGGAGGSGGSGGAGGSGGGAGGGSARQGAGGEAGSGGEVAETPTPASNDLTLPDVTLLARTKDRNLRQAGFLVDVPAGDEDVQLVATVYSHEEDVSACAPATSRLLAMGTARIERIKPDEAGGGQGGGAGQGGAGQGGAGQGGAGQGGAGQGGAGQGGAGQGGGDGGGGGAGTGGSNAGSGSRGRS